MTNCYLLRSDKNISSYLVSLFFIWKVLISYLDISCVLSQLLIISQYCLSGLPERFLYLTSYLHASLQTSSDSSPSCVTDVVVLFFISLYISGFLGQCSNVIVIQKVLDGFYFTERDFLSPKLPHNLFIWQLQTLYGNKLQMILLVKVL